MLGDGMVCLGTAVVTTDFRYSKSGPKIVWSRPTLRFTVSAAGVYSMSPAGLWNLTSRFPGAWPIPPSW